ncbi:hypothetical protein [Chroococcidiopsis sp. CCNUC1]|uniref:hypothetical protein n=1 Tax=Chroococcidiopsis sp. CCNUC1 TaxID=2653189 RepID=UPI003531899D
MCIEKINDTYKTQKIFSFISGLSVKLKNNKNVKYIIGIRFQLLFVIRTQLTARK